MAWLGVFFGETWWEGGKTKELELELTVGEGGGRGAVRDAAPLMLKPVVGSAGGRGVGGGSWTGC